MRKLFLWIEFLIIFTGAPLLVLSVRERWFMIALLWGGAAFTAILLHLKYRRNHAVEWNWPGVRLGWKDVAKLFAFAAPILVMIAYTMLPAVFLSLPRDRPELWLRIMLLYPLLSVWPQELVYRSFIYHRYKPIFGTGAGYIAASTFAFAFLHVMFLNQVAVALTLGGGYFFARSYTRYHSLALVCIEHALYGCLLFYRRLWMVFFTAALPGIDFKNPLHG